MQVLENPADGEKFPHQMMDLIVELSTRLNDAVSPFHRPQFIDTNADFAKNVIQEAIDRESAADVDHTRSVDAYMIIRRHTIGVKPCLVLMRSTRHLYIPDHVLKHPILEEIEDAILDTIYIANDIYSYKKEVGDNGALNNIITVIVKDPETKHLDAQGSIDHAGKIFQSAVARFHKYRSMLPSFGEEMDRQVQDYVDGLIDWSVGNIEWSMVNHRYNTFDDEQSRRSGVMRMVV
ncbi:putative terpene cyclase [Serpula lacrymans var. lacrymans S7.9]|nr:putative terpene cyclase [Serpula lacrymans var. lacrymans S7.9]EGO21839.1 putative terpene cyclase [Serpula lacrymans var. lacrymans S7.9]